MEYEAYELFPDPVLLLDKDYKVIYANKRAKELYELDKEQCYKIFKDSPKPCQEYGGNICNIQIIESSSLNLWSKVSLHRTKEGDKYFLITTVATGDGFLQFHMDMNRILGAIAVSKFGLELSPFSNSFTFFIWKNTEELSIEYASPNVEHILGISAEKLMKERIGYVDFVYEEDLQDFIKILKNTANHGRQVIRHPDYRVVSKDGNLRWVADDVMAILNSKGEITHFYAYVIDKTEKHEREELFRLVADDNPHGVLLFDIDNLKVIYSNQSFKNITGYSHKELATVSDMEKVVHPKDIDILRNAIAKRSAGYTEDMSYTIRIYDKYRKLRWLKINSRVVRYEGRNMALVTFVDITKEKHEESKLRKIATRDPLTGIFNRRAILNFLEDKIKLAHRYNTHFSVLMFDIDNFKNINDTYGHNIGDEVLREIVRIIRRSLRKSDIFGRWGGEEFIIILPFNREPEPVAEKIRRIVENHKFPYVEKVTISVGATTCGSDDSIYTLLERVDNALYEAKRSGKNKSVIL